MTGQKQSIQLLIDLFHKAETKETNSVGTKALLSRLKAYSLMSSEQLSDFHGSLNLAKEQGAIALDWEKHYEDHELYRVRVLDVIKLSAFLGEPLLVNNIEVSFNAIAELNKPVWLNDYLTTIKLHWLKGKTCYKIKPANTAILKDVVLSIIAIENLPTGELLDYRQFGSRYLNNSKRVKEIMQPLAEIYKERLSLDDIDAKDVLAQFDIISLSHPILMRGPMSVMNEYQTIDTNIYPFIGISPRSLVSPNIYKEPKYVITIENLSSFNEYTESINDNAIIIFTSGFPTRALQGLYRSIIVQTDCPIFHWGDTDSYGFQILKTLQKLVPNKIIKPHLMNPKSAQKYTPTEILKLECMMPINEEVDKLIKDRIKHSYGFNEQEMIIPNAPII